MLAAKNDGIVWNSLAWKEHFGVFGFLAVPENIETPVHIVVFHGIEAHSDQLVVDVIAVLGPYFYCWICSYSPFTLLVLLGP